MVFDFVSILVTSFLAALIVTIEHYFPWRKLFGRNLPAVANYVLGVAAIIVPFTLLMILWIYHNRVDPWLAVVALWSVVIASGFAVMACYVLDTFLDSRIRARQSEERELALRKQFSVEPD